MPKSIITSLSFSSRSWRCLKTKAIFLLSDATASGSPTANVIARYETQSSSVQDEFDAAYFVVQVTDKTNNEYQFSEVIAVDEKFGYKPNPDDLIGLTKVVLDMHKNGEIDQAYLCSNIFVNTMTQQPNVEQLIPLAPEEQDEPNSTQWDYIYEPEAKELLDGLLTRYIESLIYQAVIENNACEQAAKMIAMKNATDNAGDLIKELELLYNNVRQAAITQELSEIVGGASAV